MDRNPHSAELQPRLMDCTRGDSKDRLGLRPSSDLLLQALRYKLLVSTSVPGAFPSQILPLSI